MGIKPGILQWVIIFTSTLFVLAGLREVSLNDNVNSRLASAYSLVHYGTWQLDRPVDEPPLYFEQNTVDKVKIGGHVYSTKPPLMPLVMAGEYWLLHTALGWKLEPQAAAKPIIQFMTFTLGIVPHFLTLIFFLGILGFFITDVKQQTLPLFSLAFATQLPGFATTLNNHTTGVFLLVATLYFALGIVLGKRKPSALNFALFGIFGGLTFAIDLPMTIFVAVAGLYLFYFFPKQAIGIALPVMLLPLALHFGIMLYVTGSPLPIQMRESLYLYEGSYWRIPGGMDALNEPKGIYLFHATFGRYGLFLLFPILLTGVWGLLHAILKKETTQRGYIIVAGMLTGIVFSYYILTTNNYGGAAYGFRWFIGLMPVLLLMAAPVWRMSCGKFHTLVLVLLLIVSMYSAFDCYQEPWGANMEWTCSPRFFGPSFVGPE